MTEMDVELSRTVAAMVRHRHGQWEARTTHATTAVAWGLLLVALATLVLR